MAGVTTESKDLHRPSFEELVPILNSGLRNNFRNVRIQIVDCPQMNVEPFHLAAEGLCGNACIADVGALSYIFPTARTDKPQYKFDDVFEAMDCTDGLVIGAAAGPFRHSGVNCEMIANVRKLNDSIVNESRVCRLKDDSYQLQKLEVNEFALQGNFFCCEGKSGKVLEITASERTGPMNYVSCIRQVLKDHYNERAVGLGGVFMIEQGKAKIHVMPEFSKEPLNTDVDVEKWLRFFEMNAPLICVGELVSHDPGLDLRFEHFHCFSCHGDGGHYHYDTTPDSVVYRGYFNVAEKIHRIDRPEVTHDVGRD